MAGRPRNRHSDTALLAAATAVLNERGYAGLTLDEVARRAGVGKSSLYARFRDRADLAAAAVASLQPELPAPTGQIRADLIEYLRAVDRDLGQLGLGVLGSLLGQDPETLAVHRERVIGPRACHSRQLLRDAQARGEIRTDADLDATMELLIGSILARVLAGGTEPQPLARTSRRRHPRRPHATARRGDAREAVTTRGSSDGLSVGSRS
jgi:AcrR family transcriptional regulator